MNPLLNCKLSREKMTSLVCDTIKDLNLSPDEEEELKQIWEEVYNTKCEWICDKKMRNCQNRGCKLYGKRRFCGVHFNKVQSKESENRNDRPAEFHDDLYD